MATSFTVNKADLEFILRQIKIAEATSVAYDSTPLTIVQAIQAEYGMTAAERSDVPLWVEDRRRQHEQHRAWPGLLRRGGQRVSATDGSGLPERDGRRLDRPQRSWPGRRARSRQLRSTTATSSTPIRGSFPT